MNLTLIREFYLRDIQQYFKKYIYQNLGELIAIWENKTIFMSMFWNINPFDQWVELGKLNTKKEIE